MQAILGQLVTVPGVVGGMVYDTQGKLLSRTFPALFDDGMLASAARVLVDGTAGLEGVTGAVGLLDLRFADARIVVRPMAGAHLLLLCAAKTNLQLLAISASVAVPKLEKLVAALPPPPLDPPPPVLSRKEAKAAAKKKKKEGREPREGGPEPEEDPGFFHW